MSHSASDRITLGATNDASIATPPEYHRLVASDDAGGRPTLRLRTVEASDADLLLAWANDPDTRRASFRPALIERAGHLEWLASRLASPTTAFWIGESDGRAVGQVRLEQQADGVAEVSITVAPQARGAGIGRELLAAAVAEAGRALPVGTLRARVRADNVPSLALFEALGFRARGHALCDGVSCIEYERELTSS